MLVSFFGLNLSISLCLNHGDSGDLGGNFGNFGGTVFELAFGAFSTSSSPERLLWLKPLSVLPKLLGPADVFVALRAQG